MAPLAPSGPGTGRYIITNSRFKNVVYLADPNWGSDLRADSQKDRPSEMWDVVRLRNGNYTIKNYGYGSYASYESARPNERDHIVGGDYEKQWTIIESEQHRNLYVILPTRNGHVYWHLFDGESGTPITLQFYSQENNFQWKFSNVEDVEGSGAVGGGEPGRVHGNDDAPSTPVQMPTPDLPTPAFAPRGSYTNWSGQSGWYQPLSEEPFSMLSPLVFAPTHRPRNHHPLSTIHEMPSASNSLTDHVPTPSHANTLPNSHRYQGSLTSGAHPPSSHSLTPNVRDRETPRHTTTASIDAPPSSGTPSPRRPVLPPSVNRSPVGRGSNDGPNITPPNTDGNSSLPPTPASHGHSRRRNFIPPHPPASHDIRIRRGYWNRRGDHLTKEGYVVCAPTDKAYPPELSEYPHVGRGFRDEKGVYFVTNFFPMPELSTYPYDMFVTYV